VESAAARTRLRQRGHLLAQVPGLDALRCLATPPPTVAGTSQRTGRNRSFEGDHRFLLGARGFWGAHTGPNPTDRAKNGVKRHIITEAGGLPVVVKTTPANQRDDQPALPMLKAVPVIRGRPGRPRGKPGAFYGDRGYGSNWVIAAVAALGVISMLAPRGAEHGSGLGKIRYVVERTFAWFDNWRRLRMCYEKSDAHYLAFNQLAACLICARRLATVRGRL
jgi:transposase